MASRAIENRRRAQLDQSLQRFENLPSPPPRGWVRAVRSSLGVSMRQLAGRMGASSSSTVAQVEAGEANGSITLRRLRAAADALDCDLVYGLVPRHGSLQATVRARAMKVAREAMMQADRHMVLEAQGVGEERLAQLIEELAEELERASLRKLWDAPR